MLSTYVEIIADIIFIENERLLKGDIDERARFTKTHGSEERYQRVNVRHLIKASYIIKI